MQFELRTQVIEPPRKTFQHLVDRYGDRPASRYEEGTIDVQATANFHYRPLWAPDKELYDPAWSAFKLDDPYSFTDPRQFYYAPYVTSRSEMHEAFGSTLDYLEKRGLLDRLPEGWASLLQDLVLPLRHYEAAAQMNSANGCRFGYGTSITQCLGYAAFDRIGIAQILSRAGIAFGGGTAEPLEVAKRDWIEEAALQPLRKLTEEMLVEQDWAVGFITLDITDQLLYGLLYSHLDEAALMGGAGSYSLLAQHLSGWFADQRRWVDALYKAWITDPVHGTANAKLLGEVAERALTAALGAVRPIAARADELVGAGGTDALDATASAIRSTLAAAGATMQEA